MSAKDTQPLWRYRDTRHDVVLFECDGNLMLTEADELLRQATGIDPVRAPHIGATNTGWWRKG